MRSGRTESSDSGAVLTLILLLGVVAIGSNALILSPILSDVAATFEVGVRTVSYAISAYGGATALSALFLGGAIDRLGARTVLISGGALLVVATAASAAAPHWTVLLMAQVAAGIAAGVMLPAIYATATHAGGPEGGARLLGRVLSGWAISLVAGIPLSALIADQFGWRATFWGLSTLSAVILPGFARLPAPAPRSTGRRAGIGAALRVPGVVRLLAVQFLFMTAFYGLYAFWGDHLRAALGIEAGGVGIVVLVYGLGFGAATVADTLIDRWGPARMLPILLLGAAAIYMAMIPATRTMAGTASIAFLWGFANHFIINVVVLDLSRRDEALRGAVLGLNSAITYAGAFAGPLSFGVLYAASGFAPIAGAAALATILATVVARHFR